MIVCRVDARGDHLLCSLAPEYLGCGSSYRGVLELSVWDQLPFGRTKLVVADTGPPASANKRAANRRGCLREVTIGIL